MKNLSFSEINDGDHFEDLVAAYFKDLINDTDSKIIQVEVKKSGVGTDGGVDIIVEYLFTDDIKTFKRKWVVQCKFLNENISPSKINSVNIPTLINSRGANGYLLVCKKKPTSKLTDLFEKLNENCDRRYQYICWDGLEFLSKVRHRPNIHDDFFPTYSATQKSS